MKIFDCFMIRNEIDMLKLRIDILDPYVDYYVLVESTVDHVGKVKPLYYDMRKHEFDAFNDKIIHVIVNENPIYDGAFSILNHQRNCIMRGLDCCMPDDTILISDIDEIPNPSILEDIRNDKSIKVRLIASLGDKECNRFRQLLHLMPFARKKLFLDIFKRREFTIPEALKHTPIMLQQDMMYYYINCRRTEKWYGTVVARYDRMELPQMMRELVYWRALPCIKNAEWHFSYMGGYQQ